MTQAAILNGQMIPAVQLSVPATDAGFIWGITVAEQLRTFQGKLFRLQEHLQRLARSLAAVGVQPKFTANEIAQQAIELAATNHAEMATGDDLCLVIFVTPGTNPAMGTGEPIVGLHTYPIPFADWAHKYDQGQRLVTTSIRQITPSNWPPSLKCRSRAHYYLADLEARQRDPQARALLLDQEGFVCEASTANVVAVFGDELVSPRLEKILPGISLATVEELAQELGLRCSYRDIRLVELADAAEIMLCSTSCCLLPVNLMDQRPLPMGPVFQQLLQTWSQWVGIDIRQQAQAMAARR